jgi:pimeloyl-ACP methyl ester carboxylesterase
MKNSTWILLRGLGREKGHWGPFADQFRARFPDDEVLFLDLPGTGEFRDHVGPTTMNEIFSFVRAKAVERTPPSTRFRLFAMSLGAMVAMEWMRRKPEDLDGAVLINTSLRSLSPMYSRLRWQVWPTFLKMAAQQNVRDREKALVELLINSESGQAQALTVWAKLGMEHPIAYRNTANQLWAAMRFEGLEDRPPMPVLLLNGLGDRFVDPSCSTALHDKWGWPLERHPWGGHDLTWDDGAWVLSKTQAWSEGL